jgi:hypothetical protein
LRRPEHRVLASPDVSSSSRFLPLNNVKLSDLF